MFVQIICSIRKCRKYNSFFIICINWIIDLLFKQINQMAQLTIILAAYLFYTLPYTLQQLQVILQILLPLVQIHISDMNLDFLSNKMFLFTPVRIPIKIFIVKLCLNTLIVGFHTVLYGLQSLLYQTNDTFQSDTKRINRAFQTFQEIDPHQNP